MNIRSRVELERPEGDQIMGTVTKVVPRGPREGTWTELVVYAVCEPHH